MSRANNSELIWHFESKLEDLLAFGHFRHGFYLKGKLEGKTDFMTSLQNNFKNFVF